MPSDSLIQLTSRLWPRDLCAEIISMPEHEVAYNLCLLLIDADALSDTDKSSWTERRLSKQMVALAALVMLAFGKESAGSSDGS